MMKKLVPKANNLVSQYLVVKGLRADMLLPDAREVQKTPRSCFMRSLGAFQR